MKKEKAGRRCTFSNVDDQGPWDGRDINPVAGEVLDLKAAVGGSLEKLGTSGPSKKGRMRKSIQR